VAVVVVVAVAIAETVAGAVAVMFAIGSFVVAAVAPPRDALLMSDAAAEPAVLVDEALRVAANLKMQSRKFQLVADLVEPKHPSHGQLMELSASLDDFADKLYRPFVGQDGIDDTIDAIDAAMKALFSK